jgi:hypothetical protein
MSKKIRKAFQSVKGGSKESLFEALELAKGITAESRTLNLLNGPQKPRWLFEAKATPQKDKMGIDMELYLADNETIIPINIKSSQAGLFNHIQKRREIGGRFVPVLIVRPRDSDAKILRRIVEVLQRYKLGRDRHKRGKKK